jgi:bifunctional DNA-binding transcriptional regulator/antitoxin component of YhaV-PrlF toxin-antitoxin module
MRKVIGTSKISTDNKMTLIEPVAEKLGIQKGDTLVFYEDNNQIIIEKS